MQNPKIENKFSTIKERVVHIVETKGISKETFFEKIGMTSANFRGNARKTPLNSTAIENIFTEFPDISLEWLLTGKGDAFKNNQQIGDIDNSHIVGANVNGSGIHISGNSKELIDIIKKQQEQMDKLIDTINKLSGK